MKLSDSDCIISSMSLNMKEIMFELIVKCVNIDCSWIHYQLAVLQLDNKMKVFKDNKG